MRLWRNRAPDESAQSSSRGNQPRMFYGWYIVGASFLANIAYTEQFSAAYGVFITHLSAEMGWGRTALAGVKTVARLVEAVLAPVVGAWIDRYGARWFMAVGGIIICVAFVLAAGLTELWHLYALFGLLGPIGSVCVGGFVTTVVVANWFLLKRGRAVGLASMGIPFGTMVLPVLSSVMIEEWGWRTSWFAFGTCAVILYVGTNGSPVLAL